MAADPHPGLSGGAENSHALTACFYDVSWSHIISSPVKETHASEGVSVMHGNPINSREGLLGNQYAARNLPTVFLLLSLVFGIIHACMMPPFQVPDETGHFTRAADVAQGHCVPQQNTLMPGDLYSMRSAFPAPLELSIPEREWVTKENLLTWLHQYHGHALEPVRNEAANLYSCAPYLPSALAVRTALLLNLPPLVVFELGRFANLIAYTLIVFAALRALPDFH